MAGNNPQISILISAVDKASSVFESLKSKAGLIATAIAGYFSFQAFGNALADAREFERQMSVVQAVSGATGKELEALKNSAIEMGDKTQYSATEAAQALEELAKAGLSSARAVEALPQVLSLAQANGLTLADAAGFITKAVNGMGLSFNDSARVADVLTQAAASTNTSVQGLGEGLSYAAPLAKTLGLSLEQTTAYMGKMADAGIDASRAGTALNSVMSQFLDPSSKFKQALADIGITTTDFNDAIVELAAKGKLGESALLALGTEAGPGMRALLNQGIPALQELTNKLENAQGAAAATAQTMGKNLVGAVKGLESSWDTLKLQLATPILKPLTDAVEWLSGKLHDLAEDKAIAEIGDFIAATFNKGLKAVQEFSEGVSLQAFIDGLKYVKTEAEKAFAVVQHSEAFDRFKKVVDFAAQAAMDLSAGIKDIVTTIAASGAVEKFLTSLFDAAGALWDTVKRLSAPFVELVATLGGGSSIADTFSAVLIDITQGITAFINAFSTGLYSLQAGFFGIAGTIATIVAAALEGAGKIAEGFTKITFGDVATKFQANADELKRISESFAVAAQENFGKASVSMDKVAEAAEKTRDSFAEWDSPIAQVEKLGEATGITADKWAALVNGVKVADDKLANVASTAASTAKNMEGMGQSVQDADAALKAAANAASALESAYRTLGVKSSDELKRLATIAETAFNTIRASGTATAADIRQAFQAYAEKAVAANNGILDSHIKAVAASNQLGVSVSGTGKIIVDSFELGGKSAEQLVVAINKSSAAAAALAAQQAQAMRQLQEYEDEELAANAARQASTEQDGRNFRAELQANGAALAASMNSTSAARFEQLQKLGRAWVEAAQFEGVQAGWNAVNRQIEHEMQLVEEATAYNNRMTESINRFAEAGQQGIGHTALQLERFIADAESGNIEIDKLSQMNVDALRSSLSAARQELRGMSIEAESARDKLLQLQNEYDTLNGNTEAVAQRNFQSKKQALEDELASTRSDQAQRDIKESLRILDEINRIEASNRQQKARQASTPTNQAEPTRTAQSVAQAATKPVAVINFSFPDSAPVPGLFAESDVNNLLSLIAKAGTRTSGGF